MFSKPLALWKSIGPKEMPRYFFNVREANGEIGRDTEGQELPDLEAARSEAISANREILGEWLLHGGKLDPRQIEITDKNGTILATIKTGDVLFRDGEFRSYSDDVTKSAPTGLARSTGKKDLAE